MRHRLLGVQPRPFPWWRAVVAGVLVATSGCARTPTRGEPLVLLTGEFRLRSVDGLALPATVPLGIGLRHEIRDGTLWLSLEGFVRIELATAVTPGGSMNAGPMYQAQYLAFASDSVLSAQGLTGRVWRDSAEIRTTAFIPLGDHVWRFDRRARE